MELKFRQKGVKLKCSIYKKDYTPPILCHLLQQNLIIGKYITYLQLLQNYIDIPAFNNIRRLKYSSPMNNAVTNKTKHFPQLFALGPLQITSKRKLHFLMNHYHQTRDRIDIRL